MRIRSGVVLPMMFLLVTPLSVVAQQRSPAIPDSVMAAKQGQPDPPQEAEMKPDEQMSASGFFLGIIGMLGGAAVGSQIGQSDCPSRDVDKDCMGRHAYTGALIAGTIMVPIGVHLANKDRRHFLQSLGVSVVTGTALYYGFKAVPGSPIAMAPFLAAPLQIVTSMKIERRQ